MNNAKLTFTSGKYKKIKHGATTEGKNGYVTGTL